MYLLTKVVLAVMLGFIVSALLGLIIVPILKNFKIGQRISTYMDFAHRTKQGTPTMGGLIFIIATILVMAFLLLTNKVEFTNELKIVMFVFVSYAIIGFLDDFLSIKRGKNEGLTVTQKLLLQLFVALVFFYLYIKNGGQTSLIVSTLGINI